MRNEDVGSLFIIKLCEQFMKEAHEDDVVTMLAAVKHKISKEACDKASHVIVQTAAHINGTFDMCYLNPGIYRDDNGLVGYIKTEANEPNILQVGKNGVSEAPSNVNQEANSANQSSINIGAGGSGGGGGGGNNVFIFSVGKLFN